MTNGQEQPSFYVIETVEGRPNEVIGRCGDFPIRRGEIFATACLFKPRERLEDFALPPELLASEPVLLKVLEIRAYERTVTELGAGMTGLLVLDGKGIEQIVPGMALKAKTGVLVA